MSTPTIIRVFASLGLLGSLLAAGYFYIVAGIRATYFPESPNGYLWNILAFAIIAAFCLLAAYFVAAIRCGRFLWIMRAPRSHHQRDDNDVA
jgi:ABC-type multidrug transport system permease subunit